MQSTYRIYWNPDSRWNHGHWSVSHKYSGITSGSHYTFLSDALRHPLEMKEKYPDTIIILPSEESKEKARRYYGAVLEEMFNVTDGVFIGC